MMNRKIIYFLVISHIFPAGNNATSQRFFSKLVNPNQSSDDRQENIEKKYKTIESSHAELKCKHKCITPNPLATRFQVRNQTRFTDHDTNYTKTYNKSSDDKSKEIESPSSKFSIFNLLSDDEEGEDYYDNNDKLKTDETEEEEDEEEEEEEDEEVDDGEDEQDDGEDDDFSFNFFGPDEETNSDKEEGIKGENLLKQYRRHKMRMQDLVFPLLLAYKLKFFTVIPLLMGSLVLLIGSTGVAGFFFALFAAALGVHVKTVHH